MDNVLYLESDEEITSAIEKMIKLPGQTVSIVAPKRATILQSIVNQKLLKKAAEDHGKDIVLVTADRTATHLAGKVGIAVAASLKAVPSVPQSQTAPDLTDELIENEEPDEADVPDEEDVGDAPVATKPNKPQFAKPMMVKTAVGEAARGDKKPAKVPNFNNLQKRLLWAGAAGLAVLLLVLGNLFLKKATVTLYARGTRVDTKFNFTVDPGVRESDYDKALLSGQKLELTKELKYDFQATGKKDIGTKAKGNMTIKNETGAAQTLVAGTRFVSGGKTFLSDSEVTVPGGSLDGIGNIVPGQATVAVTSEQAGDSYNLAPARYSIPALPAEKQAKIYGQGNQMTGGTSKQITVVSQADIDRAKAEALAKDAEQSNKDLESKSATGYRAIKESFAVNVSGVTSNPGLDSEAAQASLTLNVGYTGLAVSKAEYERLVERQEQKLVTEQKQIYDTGIDAAVITAGKKEPSGRQEFGFAAEAYAGDKIDTKAIAKSLAGKKFGDAIEETSSISGVEKSEIDLWPGFSGTLPRLSRNIKVEIKVAGKATE